eukprot:CAMPEP_0170650444 /NCGR_PEP_ID=MMETSP0224-20130122/45806_1 /TAXON_ID=285029 /ORGANISM="Togula jolla, Strain CCCM 725" /LENGTH=322 /DNA_ID=CAMNT_0010982107 /DNA_START=16 /DNA_END=982 /DNA_ORIENTATION=+
MSQPDLSRALHAQPPPPPPSQAPHVPPTQPPTPQGPPPSAPPLMSATDEMHYVSSEADRAAREKYGLLGILKVIRMTDPDLNQLALGMDLTTLGLNLNSPECLYATFASPWSDTPTRKDPEFYLPPCYYMNPPQLKTAHLQRFSMETLFYIFFNMPKDTLQAYAAAELYNRGWRYHRELKTWFFFTEEDDQPQWWCFDTHTWEQIGYHQEVDTSNFLGEDDVRVKMPPSGGVPSAAQVADVGNGLPCGSIVCLRSVGCGLIPTAVSLWAAVWRRAPYRGLARLLPLACAPRLATAAGGPMPPTWFWPRGGGGLCGELSGILE